MLDAFRHPLLYFHSILMAVTTARRLSREFQLRAFDDTVAWLRQGDEFPDRLADPMIHLRVVSRLLRWLPPRTMGPCLKRSLILLHLWSRCGFEPVIHLGFASDTEERWRGHAWLTATGNGQELRAGSGDGHTETFAY